MQAPQYVLAFLPVVQVAGSDLAGQHVADDARGHVEAKGYRE